MKNKLSWLLISFVFSGCSAMPEFSKAVEDIETQEAIKVIVDKECFQKDTDLQILIDVKNKDSN
jgi:hypothetical protein